MSVLDYEIAEAPCDTTTAASVDSEGAYYRIERADGWFFGLEKAYGVEVKVGDTIEMFGKGVGYPIRGVRVNGRLAFYRTEEEQKQYGQEQSYGKDATEYLRRWDEDGRIWSVTLGGLGPSYEQAIQIAMMEALRILLSGATLDHDSFLANDRVRHLGLSGAQAGAACSFARQIERDGPIITITRYPDDRRIQVGTYVPTVEALDRAIAEEKAAAA